MTQMLDDTTRVSGQIQPGDVAAAAAAGVAMIVNNRPDGEEPGQPAGAAIADAAAEAGIAYRHIPVEAGFEPEMVAAMGEALDAGPALIFCKSGTRSAYLWALARAKQGADANDLVHRAGQAGYNVRPLLPWLRGEEG